MISAELRGPYDFGKSNDALVVLDQEGQRIALFLDQSHGRPKNLVSVSVSLPGGKGTRCYSVDFDWLLDHLLKLEPHREVRP